MFNLQGSEIIVILLLALVVLGPEKLPDAIRKFTQTYGELKKMGNGFQSELKSALEEPMREMRETADLVQRSADPRRIMEESENEARLRAEADAAALNGSADVPVDPAAFAVPDPVAASNGSMQGAPITAKPAKPANGESVKKVNQVALSMARGPIESNEPVKVPETVPAGASSTVPLTALPQGAASMLAPPPAGTVVTDAPAPPPAQVDDVAGNDSP